MKRRSNGIRFAGFCVLALLASAAWAKDSAIIIFDGSGSMWGQVEGKAKIAIAREVMGTLVEDWNEDIDLGLLVYGHREKGNCADIEMLVPVAAPDSAKVLAAIDAVSPKGETPIGDALVQAATSLNHVENAATVILISDGEESCSSDPCAVAEQLEKSGINFTAHVIGFDVSGEKQAKAQQQLRCVADKTGGKFFEAKNTAGLKTALAETARAVASPAAVAEPARDEKSGPTGIALNAVPADGADAFAKSNDVMFAVDELAKAANGKRKRLDYSYKADPFFELPPGNYLVSALRGNSLVETILAVKAGETTRHTFNLNAGNLTLSAVPAEGAEAFSKSNDVMFTVDAGSKNMDGKRERVDYSYDATPMFRLAAGQYLVGVERGNARVETMLDVKAGELAEHVFTLDTGNLRLSATAADGAAPFGKSNDVSYIVYTDKKDMDGKRKKVDYSYDASPLFKLAAGQYYVTAERGNAVADAVMEVKAGELAEFSFNLNAGNLRVFTLPAEGAEPITDKKNLKYTVYLDKKDMDGKRQQVDYSYDASPVFKLAAGQYLVVVDHNDNRAQSSVEVKAGELIEHSIVVAKNQSAGEE